MATEIIEKIITNPAFPESNAGQDIPKAGPFFGADEAMEAAAWYAINRQCVCWAYVAPINFGRDGYYLTSHEPPNAAFRAEPSRDRDSARIVVREEVHVD